VKRREFVTSAAVVLSAAGAGDPAYGAGANGNRQAHVADPASRAVPFDRGMVDGYEFITSQQSTLYWTVPPARMYQPAVAHAQLGAALLSGQGPQKQRSRLAGSLAQASLLAARLAYFDLKRPDQARLHYRNALIAAREADDHQLGSAILAHLAFIPAYEGHPGEARDLMRAAYAHAARGVSVTQRSWLHAVDAEVEAKLGDGRRAVDLITRAEDAFAGPGDEVDTPEWLDYYDRTRLNGFKGFCHIVGGSPEAAREALQCSLMALKPSEAKQRTIVLADMADICVRTKEIDEACVTLVRALENLEAHWYAMGWDRIVNVRKNLDPHSDTRMVRDLDVRLHSSWPGTMRMSA
jgi:tetratricopeptide (TPR) repeat protein